MHVCARVYVSLYLCVYVCMCVCRCVFLYLCMCVCAGVCMCDLECSNLPSSLTIQFLSKESLTTPSQVTLLYHSLSDGVGSSTTSITAVVELPSNTSQEAEHVQLILDNFSGIQSISRFQVVGSPTVYSLKPASEPVTMQQLLTYVCTYIRTHWI